MKHHSQEDFADIIAKALETQKTLTTSEAKEAVLDSGVLNAMDLQVLPSGHVRWEQIVRNCLKSNDYMVTHYPMVEHIDGGIKLSTHNLTSNEVLKFKREVSKKRFIVEKPVALKLMAAYFKDNRSTLDEKKCLKMRDDIVLEIMNGVSVEDSFKNFVK